MNITLEKAGTIDIRVCAPPSKSYTHRALIAAGLAEGSSIIGRPLRSGDTRITASALQQMGVSLVWNDEQITVSGNAGKPVCDAYSILDMGDSGTSLRLLTTVALLCGVPVIVTGSPRMKERPVEGLVSALNKIGGGIQYLEAAGFPPFLVDGNLLGGRVKVDSTVSSQFSSSLLLSAPYATSELELILLPGSVSRSYLDVTVDVMQAFGVAVEREGYDRFMVEPGKGYRGRSYCVEGDYSSASYFFAMAAVCGGRARVSSLAPDSVQGDRQFLLALESMGCRISCSGDCITLESDGDLEGIEMDLSNTPDTVQTLCMVAACARSPSRFYGISHIRYKESDRILAILSILQALGGDVTAEKDGSIRIRPAPLHGGRIDPAGDHRTAMSAAVLGLAVGGVTVTDAGCVSKSFPEFWEILHKEGLV
jgi:3-phosphoshikimate 1-carboxyvinyltransferase